MKRKIITIDEDKCDGCGLCIPNCPEGALQVIDGKVRLVSDLFCDGLGACIGHCPTDAIWIEEREAEPYSERKVMENIIKAGAGTIKAHLSHLKDHGEDELFKQAVEVLNEKGVEIPELEEKKMTGCPGSQMMNFTDTKEASESQLKQWPVQLHLVPPNAPYFQGKDVLLAADCVAYSMGNFHKDYLKGRSVAIACPKLDENQDVYVEKLTAMLDVVNTLTVMIMEVPCCQGLLQLAITASEKSSKKVPIKKVIVGINGEVKEESWV
jgi:ferredoxin